MMSSTTFVGSHSTGLVALGTHTVAVAGAQLGQCGCSASDLDADLDGIHDCDDCPTEGRSTALHLAVGSIEPAIGEYLAERMAQRSALATPDMVPHHTAHGAPPRHVLTRCLVVGSALPRTPSGTPGTRRPCFCTATGSGSTSSRPPPVSCRTHPPFCTQFD